MQGKFTSNYIPRASYKLINEEVQEFYRKLSNLLGGNYLRFEMAHLYDMVIGESNNSDILITALDIRNSKDVNNFKKWLKDIEQACADCNFVAVSEALSSVHEISSQLQNKLHGRKSINITIAFPPSINFQIDLSSNNSRKRKVGTMFIRTLLNNSFRNK